MILHLNVKKEFFDMIKNGEKKEEYREVKPYWIKRLLDIGIPNIGYKAKGFDYIQFKNGYQKGAPTLLIECKGITIGKPNKE